ncbi:DNA repair exonuclease [Paenibacillus sp. PK3_47]|uniref:metallophosphoesterase family protein n=1 Tax=Paenibacillus sp. PK3_47 TaxID=2072642 RepID=UPI00201E271E|nr:DNA repair exonuclease [Paenibacillus sp. PK3_47]UQZ36095.1 DNA repair exonuclease [Paenibacillus sp. PK3_47]
MIPFRFLHAADLHLDSRFAGLARLPQAIRSYLRESTFAALGRLVGVAVQEEVDFVVISGDVYDITDASLQGQLRFQEALQELGRHGIEVFLIHGNHDPLDGPRLQTPPPGHVTVFGGREPGQAVARRRSDGKEVAVVSGISYPTAKVTENTALRFSRKPGSSLYHIALLHGNVDGDLQHETYSPCSRRDLIGRGFDYWALGHIHKRSILHERPAIVYPGNIQGRSIKETGPKGCYVVDVSTEGAAELKFRELDFVRWHAVEISIAGLTREAEWISAVEQAVEAIRDSHPGLMSVVRFRLTGRGNVHRVLAEKGALDDLLTELQRRETLRAQRKDYAGLVWTEGFSLESGLAVDRVKLLQEDSFLGEMLRLSGSIGQSTEAMDELTGSALRPLLENQELRRLLSAVTDEEKRSWLDRAAELGITLLSGAEDSMEGTVETGRRDGTEVLITEAYKEEAGGDVPGDNGRAGRSSGMDITGPVREERGEAE